MNTYVVQSGDTLSSIARRFGVSVAAIADANAIDDPNVIATGWTLQIPGSREAPATYENSLTPVVVTAKKAKAVVIPGTGGPMFDIQEWLKPPKLYYTLAALALGAFMFSKKGRR